MATKTAHGNEADEIRTLGKLLEKGYLYRGLKPVNWCFDCGSALAEAEVEYEDRKSPTIDVAFEAIDRDPFVRELVDQGLDVGEEPYDRALRQVRPEQGRGIDRGGAVHHGRSISNSWANSETG